MIQLGLFQGQGRHLPYTKRGRKKLAIVQILKRIKDKKAAIAIALSVTYLTLDYAQDGMLDGSLLISLGNFWVNL